MRSLFKYGALIAVFLVVRVYVMLTLGYQVAGITSSVKKPRTLFDRPWVEFDPVRGIRHIPGPHREQQTYNNEIIFDAVSQINAQGIISRRDYSFKKKKNTFRVVVLGDSFTSAPFLETNWPDRVQQLFDQDAKGSRLEIYSFAVNPASTVGWQRIFFQEILPQYEFDALILAAFEFPPFNGFVSSHQRGDTLYVNFAVNGHPSPSHLKYPKEAAVAWQATSAEMDRTASLRSRFVFVSPIDFAFRIIPEIFSKIVKKAEKGFSSAPGVAPNTTETSDLSVVREIFASCRSKGKQVMLVPIPRIEWLHNPDTERESQRADLKRLADQFNAIFVDVYPHFEKLSRDALVGHFLKYDAHWNQHGSNLFAGVMEKVLTEQWGNPPPARSLSSH